MTYIDEISKSVIVLIRAGAVCRIMLCLVRLMTSEEEAIRHKKRIGNTLAFYVAAELAFVMRDIFIRYFS
ncbi:MAG: mercury transporter [Clostridiales Family XIII bacterium]|jgi:hypothetical protein|nr:mercury transporter [Clostridiales Family XIII bacterium]